MEFITIIIVSMVVTFLNSAHVILQWTLNKPGETFTGIAHSFADYFLYVGMIAQGAAGRWIWAEHVFTNEPMKPTWYYWFYVTLGHIGSWIGLSPFATYNGSLVLFVIVLVLVWYTLAKTLYTANRFLRLTSFLMILTATNWYWNTESLGQFWFSPAPVFNRLGGVPYHVFQTILFVLLCMAFSKKSRLLPLLAFTAGIANPIQTLLLTLASRSVLVAIFGGLGAWITHQEFSRQAVFAAARSWELEQYVINSLPILLLSIGPVLLFIPFGIRNVLNRHDPLRTLLLVWGVGSFAVFLSPVPRLLSLSPVRFLHPVPYAAALGILGAEGLGELSNVLHRRVIKKIHVNAIRVVFIALYLFLTIPAIARQYVDRITPARNPQLLMDTIYNHVPAPITEALTWLKVTGRDPVSHPVVFVDPAIPIEVLVPVFTGLPSFSGHPIHTLYPYDKEAKRQEFFDGTLNEKEAMQFLKDHRIGSIITIPSRQWSMSLQKVFTNAMVTIYKSP